jgi:hypothetical protein
MARIMAHPRRGFDILDRSCCRTYIPQSGEFPPWSSSPLYQGGVSYLTPREAIPPILKQVIDNAQKPHPPEADEAGRKLALNPYSREALEEYIAAKRRARQ